MPGLIPVKYKVECQVKGDVKYKSEYRGMTGVSNQSSALNIRAEGLQARVDVLIAAVDLVDVRNLALSLC